MSNREEYQIEVTDPTGIHFEGAAHAVTFTRYGTTDVLHLTEEGLDALETAIAGRRAALGSWRTRRPEPRTAEQIIGAGDLPGCSLRELNGIAREMGIATTGRNAVPQHRLRSAIVAEARASGWIA